MIKKYWKYGVVAIVLILFVVMWSRSCKTYDKLSILKGKYEQQLEINKDLQKSRDKAIEAKKVEIEELRGMVDSANTVIARHEEGIETRNARLRALRFRERELSAEVENLESVKEQRDNFKLQRDELEEKFNLAQSVITEKDGVIVNLEQQYSLQVEISDDWQAKYLGEVELNKTMKDLVKYHEKKIDGLRFRSKLKNIITLAAVGGAAYFALKK